MLSDRELVSSVLGGDVESFALLVRRYERSVTAVALNVLGDYHLAQDTAQDVFVTAFQKLSTLRQEGSFGSWIRQIARRQAFKVRERRMKSSEQTLSAEPSVTEEWKTPDDDLLWAVASLPESERQVVMLKYFDGLTVKQISQAMNQSVGSITKTLSRAYQNLRQRIQRTET